MSLLKKIFGKKQNDAEKRKSERKQLKEFFKIQLTIKGKKFRINDFSEAGIGLWDEGVLPLDVGKTYSADLVAYGQKKCTIRLKIVRKSAQILGCEVLDKEAFKTFEEDYLSLVQKT